MALLATEEEIILLGFSPKELACKCCGIHRIDIGLLHRMRCFFDFTLKLQFIITSCCRCWDHHVNEYKRFYGNNWEKKLTRWSQHLVSDQNTNICIATAMDITGEYLHLEAVDLFMKENWQGGYHFYRREVGPSIHFDIGRKRRWR